MIIDEIAEYLEDESVGTIETDIFVGKQPTDPIKCLAIIDTGGGEPHRYLPISYPTFQIITRAKKSSDAEALAQDAYDALNKKANFNLPNSDGTDDDGGSYCYFIIALQEPTSIGRDENGNEEISCNFQIIKRN